mmetsp:Transcript_45098/g.115347  ORF Transcript_45098/g.115347 Transcript_45098/m.115347 type:complete len:331 (+) Transcript_45098:718-1710(+)
MCAMSGWHLYCRRSRWDLRPRACSRTKSGRARPCDPRGVAAGLAMTGGSWQGSPAATRYLHLETSTGSSESGSTIWLASSRMSTSKWRSFRAGSVAEQQVTPTTLAALRASLRSFSAPACMAAISDRISSASPGAASASICFSSSTASVLRLPSEQCREYLRSDLSVIRLREPTRMTSVKPDATRPASTRSTATLVCAETRICRLGGLPPGAARGFSSAPCMAAEMKWIMAMSSEDLPVPKGPCTRHTGSPAQSCEGCRSSKNHGATELEMAALCSGLSSNWEATLSASAPTGQPVAASPALVGGASGRLSRARRSGWSAALSGACCCSS